MVDSSNSTSKIEIGTSNIWHTC